MTVFSQRKLTVIVSQKNGAVHPHFRVQCHSENGDHLSYYAQSYAHTQFLLKRPLIGRWPSCFNYNEHLFRPIDLDGSVSGKTINKATVGNGFGNCEDTWGLGL